MNTEDLKRELESNGFLHLQNICSDTLLARSNEASKARIRFIRDALGDTDIGIGSAAGYDEIVQRSPGRWDIPVSLDDFGVTSQELPWWPLISAVLGEDAEAMFSGVVYSEPATPAQEWHIDSPHEGAEHFPAHALNVLVALHDIPLNMGPTEFAAGSHKLTNHHANSALQPDRLIYQHADTKPSTLLAAANDPDLDCWAGDLSAGSCLMFDDRILHRGLANQTSDSRYVAYFSYRRRGYSESTHFEAQRSVFAG